MDLRRLPRPLTQSLLICDTISDAPTPIGFSFVWQIPSLPGYVGFPPEQSAVQEGKSGVADVSISLRIFYYQVTSMIPMSRTHGEPILFRDLAQTIFSRFSVVTARQTVINRRTIFITSNIA